MSEIIRPAHIAISRVVIDEEDAVLPVARLREGAAPSRNGCPFHDVRHMLRDVGLRPTRQRLALGWLL
ncbi:MAG TPA: transcriptional repressor, partial [Ancylobacter sp.]